MFRQKWTNPKAAQRQSEIYQRLWRNFKTYSKAEDGRFDDPEWSETPGQFCACIISVPADAIYPEFQPIRDALEASEGVRCQPDGFHHVMLQELGLLVEGSESRYQVTPERLEEFIAAAESQLSNAPAFWLHLGGINAFRDSVVLEARDEGQTERIHRRLNELAALPVRSAYAYLPHVTVAHLLGGTSTRELVPLLEPWRTTHFGTHFVDHVEIATIEVQGKYPEFNTRARIALKM